MLKKIWHALAGRLRSKTRLAALKLGVRQPRMAYPFAEVLQTHPTGRPMYRWGLLCAAFTARELGYERISSLEFGVAGGAGLLQMEKIAAEVERVSGVAIDVYGFDTGTGLTKPQDYRDLPQLWQEGDYGMDADALRSRLQRAKLILGPVADTVAGFIDSKPAPVGFIAFDLDLYSSTMHAFQLFDAPEDMLMPRVNCYFDDIIGYSHGDFSGERLAISDFNETHEKRKLSPIYGMRQVLRVAAPWPDMMYLFHDFNHPRYNDYDGLNTLFEIPID